MIELAEIDWVGIAAVISAVGGILAAVLQAQGKQAAVKQVEAVVRGVEEFAAKNNGHGDELKAEITTAAKDAGVHEPLRASVKKTRTTMRFDKDKL